MRNLIGLLAALPLVLAAGVAHGADILSAVYDARTDSIMVEIAYRGLRPDHDFYVRWGECSGRGVVGRLIDDQGDEAARTGFRVVERIPLEALPCRPALVTLRLGRASHMSVRVPG